MKRSLRSVSVVAAMVLLTTGLFAQESREKRPMMDTGQLDAMKADLDRRAVLAEQLVADKESPGREFPAAYRTALIEQLKKETVEQLEARTLIHSIAVENLGDTTADLTYTTFQQPCRIIDTRLAGGALSGGSPGVTRTFVVAGSGGGFALQGGTAGGCGVPIGATSVLINFVAVNPQGLGNLKGAAYNNAIPATGSIINYQLLSPALNIANGILFPICDPSTTTCNADMNLAANGAGVDVVADVLGYANKFPKQQVRSFTNIMTTGNITASGCSDAVSVAVTAPVDGTVIVRARSIVRVSHMTGGAQADEVDFSIATVAASCAFQQGDSFVYVPLAAPTDTYFTEANLARTFSVTAGSTTTFYLAGAPFGAGAKNFWTSVITAEFQPN